jgi:hypothetical protein
VAEEDGRDLRNELDRLKKRARGVFGGVSGARAPEAPPVPEAEEAGKAPRREIVLLPEIPVSDDRVFNEPGPGAIEDLVPGMVAVTPVGPFWRVVSGAADLWDGAGASHSAYLGMLASPPLTMPAGGRALDDLIRAPAGSIVYLDLETTGLRSTPLFLVGLMYSEGDDLVLDQLFARDYTEEIAVLSFVSGMLQKRELLVTFNGNTFDVPFLVDRMTFHRLPVAIPRRHLDLLPVSRSMMKGRTPNHRLQTLERFVLGRKRTGDIPGSEIPGAYHEYVRTGDARRMAAVIHHNRLDLLSMMELITVYLGGRL